MFICFVIYSSVVNLELFWKQLFSYTGVLECCSLVVQAIEKCGVPGPGPRVSGKLWVGRGSGRGTAAVAKTVALGDQSNCRLRAGCWQAHSGLVLGLVEDLTEMKGPGRVLGAMERIRFWLKQAVKG
jgi:hypothetical protein